MTDGMVEIPAWLAAALVWAARAVGAMACAAMFSTWLSVRDLERLANDPNGALPGSLTRVDWDYEKRFLLIELEQVRTQLDIHDMKIEEIEEKLP